MDGVVGVVGVWLREACSIVEDRGGGRKPPLEKEEEVEEEEEAKSKKRGESRGKVEGLEEDAILDKKQRRI